MRRARSRWGSNQYDPRLRWGERSRKPGLIQNSKLQIRLIVDDGKCLGQQTMHIEVFDARDLVESLIRDINKSTLPRSRKLSLIGSLNTICKHKSP